MSVSKFHISFYYFLSPSFQIKHLATFSSDPPPAVTRLLFSREDVEARKYIKKLMREARLRVHEDAVGNVFGIWDLESESENKGDRGRKTSRSNAAAMPPGLVLSGSHTDAIPLAGAYDGVVGVLGAIAALKSLREASNFSSNFSNSSSSSPSPSRFRFRPKRPLAAVMFSSEEPTRYGLSCLGSRALAGELSAEKLVSLRDENGTGFFESANAAGVTGLSTSSSSSSSSPSSLLSRAKATLASVKLSKQASVSAFLELHIEQAATLQERNAALGVVTAIAAPAALNVAFKGPGGHAGALPMRLRADAGLAAAAFALDVEGIALRASREESGGDDSVATVGVFALRPGAVNSVPREASLTVDVRDVSGARRDRMLGRIREAAKSRARERAGVSVEVEVASEDAPAAADAGVVAAAAAAAAEVTGASETETETRKRPPPSLLSSLFFSARPHPAPPLVFLPSRAYHDALFISRIAPTGMLFVRCLNGWSHRPDESATAADIEAGTKALALALAELAGDATAAEGGAEGKRAEAGRCPVTGAVGRVCAAASAARKEK